jgi:hypothetical protein
MVYLSQYNINASQDDNGIRDFMAHAKVFQNSEVDETRRTHVVAPWLGRAVTDKIKP